LEILKYGEEHRKFRERLRGFFDREVIPHADEWDRNHHFPYEIGRAHV